jgi:RpiB/LacA/LacB family sugar-phosphate isomerase
MGKSTPRSIAIGSDHAGFALKERIKRYLAARGWPYRDFGTDSDASTDYPDYGLPVAESVAKGEFDQGILVCGTGIGMSVTANKVPGIIAALCTSPEMADLSRRHNNANILALGGRTMSEEEALSILDVWLRTPFEGGRHARRVGKIQTYETSPK